jgi:hypothetical protein
MERSDCWWAKKMNDTDIFALKIIGFLTIIYLSGLVLSHYLPVPKLITYEWQMQIIDKIQTSKKALVGKYVGTICEYRIINSFNQIYYVRDSIYESIIIDARYVFVFDEYNNIIGIKK